MNSLPWERSDHLDLQVFLRLANANPIVLGKPLDQMDSLMDQAVP